MVRLLLLIILIAPVYADEKETKKQDESFSEWQKILKKSIEKGKKEKERMNSLMHRDQIFDIVRDAELEEGAESDAQPDTENEENKSGAAATNKGDRAGESDGGKKIKPSPDNVFAYPERNKTVETVEESTPEEKELIENESGPAKTQVKPPNKPVQSPANRASTRKPRTNDSQVFIPSQIEGRKNTVVESENKPQRVSKFGIPLGTEIRVLLPHTVTNVQPNLVVLETQQAIIGSRRTLPAKTKLFARPSVVKGSSRLFLTVVKGITPNNKEFRMNASLYDTQKTPGFRGTIISDGKIIERSAYEGLSTAGDALINEITGESIIGRAAKEASGSMLDEKDKEAQQSLSAPSFIVQVYSQEGILVVGESF